MGFNSLRKLLKIFRGNIARHAAWMMSGALFQSGSAFIANLILVRVLLPEDFGRFAIIMANIGLAQAIVSIPIGTVVLRAPQEEIDNKISLYAAANIIQNLVVLIVALSVLVYTNKFDLRSGLLLASALSSNWVSMQMNLYERNFQYKKLSLLETCAHFTGHIAAIAGALSGLGSVVLYGRELVRQLNLIIGLKLIDGLRPIPLRWLTLKDWKVLFQQISGFWLDGLLASSFSRLVILTVGGLAGESAAGYFFQAQRLAILPHQFLQPITQRIAVNYFSHRIPATKKIKALNKGLLIAGLILAISALAIAVLSPMVIPTLFGRNWQPVVPILQTMTGFVLSATLFNLLRAYFVANAQMKLLISKGRISQYFGFGLVVLIASLFQIKPIIGIGLALSSGYIAATAILIGETIREQRIKVKSVN